MVSQHVYELCHAEKTVSSEVAKTLTEPPESIVKRLYGHHKLHKPNNDKNGHKPETPENLIERALECGHWPPDTRPSDLFLQAFVDVLACLDANPLSGVVSPPLMGSHGVMPLTIVAPLVDIIKHCAWLITRAKREVIFVTCVWTPSVAQRLIKESLIKLSERAKLRSERVTVRIMYDRAEAWHAMESHQFVKPATYTSQYVELPSPEEVPNLDLEVMNFHTVMLGTLHTKFCIVDGEIAAVMSNNVEDNANMEMLTHLEGPVVTSIRDTALISWWKGLNLKDRSLGGNYRSSTDVASSIGSRTGLSIRDSIGARDGDENLVGEIERLNSYYAANDAESSLQRTNHQLNAAIKTPIEPTGPDIPEGEEMTPYMSTMTRESVPMTVVSRPPYGACDSSDVNVPQNEAWLSLVRYAKKSIFIQTPDLNAEPLLVALSQALSRGVEVTYNICFGYNDAGEMIPGQGGTNEQAATRLITSLPPDGPERDLLHIYNYVAKDQNRPIHDSFKSRSCHVKVLIVDESVGIQGSGNQDTQSWYHSQELNVMVDSPVICTTWRRMLDQNQNTQAFGKAHMDGIWRDAEGQPGEGYSGDPGVVGGLVQGVAGMIRKTARQSRGSKVT